SGRTWIAAAAPEGLPAELARRIAERGGTPLLQLSPPDGPLAALVDLTALSGAPLWEIFDRCRQALAAGASGLWAASALGGLGGLGADDRLRGAGVAGLLKTLARERPGLEVRAIDLDPAEPAEQLAGQLEAELTSRGEPREALWQGGVRRAFALRDGPPPKLGVSLSPESVVLLTGGARGITAQLAVALASRFHCQLELVGLRPVPPTESPELATAPDLPSLRRALLASRGGALAEVEAAAQATLAAREARRTLRAIEAAGGRASYQPLDVRSKEAVAALLQDIERRHGRLDAVFHAAGVTDDRRFEDKSREAFERVIDTKLGGARALAGQLGPDLKLFALFGSVSGLFGNRGQVDYSAANDALDRLARSLGGRFAGPTVALDFGPWAGAGMVTPELVREYERRKIPLLPLASGMDAVLAALFDAPPGGAVPAGSTQLFFAAQSPSAFEEAPEGTRALPSRAASTDAFAD
ncbi:MAG: SDR family NAD(P)-dependent oxidoreductase, partial [Deltaproteobacteria bacterium]